MPARDERSPHTDTSAVTPATPALPGSTHGALRPFLPPALAGQPVDDAAAHAHLAAVHATLHTYLPRRLLTTLLHTATTPPWLEWDQGSLLFADLSGSTALAERLAEQGREGIELVTGFLNSFFADMTRVLDACGGDLLAFGGDALLVLFTGPAHASTAVHAALALQRELHAYVHEVPGVGRFPMALRVGVESGRLALMAAGSPGAMRYGMLGSTVNAVARAESYAERGEVVVGPHAWEAVATRYELDAELGDGFVRVVMPALLDPLPLPTARAPIVPPATLPALLDDLQRMAAFVPPDVVARVVADPRRPVIEADLRPVTVLFAHILGLGEIAERLPPAEAAHRIQAVIAPLQEIIARYGGTVNKLDLADEGDKLLAIFGAPVAYEDHAERAARAALDMARLLRDLQPAPSDPDLEMRIGLNTGVVFSGNVGTPARKEYTVMGDAVNVAARVMGRAARGAIWCSQATEQIIARRIRCLPQGTLHLRGKREPMALFQIDGEIESIPADEPEALPLVGRQSELAWLHGQLQACTTGAGRVVRVQGEAGVGKTRLVEALMAQAREQGVAVLHTTCLSFASNIPLAPWAELLKLHCGIVAGDPQPVRAARLSEALERLGPGQSGWLPLLADMVRLEADDNRLTRGLDPQLRQERRFDLLASLLAPEHQPRLLVIEDLHWADQTSLDLWRHLARVLPQRPTFVLGLHRPGLHWDTEEADGAAVLNLEPLSSAESTALLAALPGSAHVPAALAAQLTARAAGNPLFLAELVRAVAATPAERTVALDELPDSLQGLLLARIDRLDEPRRRVVRLAAVVGQRFPYGALAALYGDDEHTVMAELVQHLNELDRQDLTALERDLPERVDVFRHALLQEVAYQSLLFARRRELHARVGEFLERRHTANLEPYYGLLAHHFRLSNRRDKAVTYLLLAGDAARQAFANDDALQSYLWVIDLLQDARTDDVAPDSGVDLRAALWRARNALGEVYRTVGRYAEALAQHDLVLATGDGLPAVVAVESHHHRALALELLGRYDEALAALAAAEALASTHLDQLPPLLLPTLVTSRAAVHFQRAEYDQALVAAHEGLALSRRQAGSHEDERIEARLHQQIGIIHGMRGDYGQARYHLESALHAQEASDDLAGMSKSHNNLGYLWQLQGEYERALDHYRQSETIARQINLRFMISLAGLNTAYAAYSLARYDQAEQGYLATLELLAELDDRQGIANAFNDLGLIYTCRGDFARALEVLDQSIAIHRVMGAQFWEAQAGINKAAVLIALRRPDEALELAQTVLARADELQVARLRVEALNIVAEAELVAGNPARAQAVAGEAAAIAEQIGARLEQALALRVLGQATALLGADAGPHFAASATLCQELKSRYELARTWSRWAEARIQHETSGGGEPYLSQALAVFAEIGAHAEYERLRALSNQE